MYIVLLCGSRSCIHNTYKQLAGNTAKVMVGKENFESGSMVEACRADLCSDQYTSHKIVSLQWTFGREVSAVRARWRVFRQNSLRPGSEDPPLNPPANKVPGQWRPFNNTWPHARPYNTETHWLTCLHQSDQVSFGRSSMRRSRSPDVVTTCS